VLALCLSIRDELYAIPARNVVEVVPQVLLRSLPGAPGYVAGLLAYRGALLPVVDLSRRLIDVASRNMLSTRIVVVSRASGAEPVRYGLLTERVADIRRLPDVSDTHGHAGAAFLAGSVLDKGIAVQLLNVDALLPATSGVLVERA
jgi:chemotaxis-related protein WspB